jgi:hypothetical protein
MLDGCSLGAVVPTNSSPVVLPTASSIPHRARHAHLQRGSSRGLWTVQRTADRNVNTFITSSVAST